MTIERKVRKLQKRHQDEDDNDTSQALEDLLATRHGRRFVWLQLARAGVFSTPFTDSSRTTAFRCGEQNAGLRLLELVTSTHPDALPVLIKENSNVDSRRRAEADRLRDAARDEYDAGDYNDEG